MRGGAIGGRVEVGVVGVAAVLGFGVDLVVAEPALAVVVDLEVAGRLGEAVVVGDVVDDVVPVEQVGDRSRARYWSGGLASGRAGSRRVQRRAALGSLPASVKLLASISV